ncbi:C40 family peptidase [Aquidulcibacter sp.]|uniref:C40 family peptidase n=1 Tax=Aquidulcibacter sp. TaxID=2052990 RepID=UPI0025C3ABAF|nr:C40 family peptidase [Aquidulcibacter sp.]MCA3694957.1 C40 family peptidase [Aquidulcibacter sp.]
MLDPNLNPYRSDLAASKLKGIVEAARYVDPIPHQVSAGVAPLRKVPEPDGEQLSQALHGDVVDVYEERGGFGWGQMRSDGYVGWFDLAALSAPVLATSHKVNVLRTYAFSGPNARAAPHFLLSLGAQVTLKAERENGFVAVERAGWIYEAHLAPQSQMAKDPVAIAEQFLHAPYQWGGVESLGLDCSGLIQTAFRAAGIALPRDSYMQREVGKAVRFDESLTGLKRGDIVCWKGHVALMTDETHILHANGYHMAVAHEPLAAAVERIGESYGSILTIRRLAN